MNLVKNNQNPCYFTQEMGPNHTKDKQGEAELISLLLDIQKH